MTHFHHQIIYTHHIAGNLPLKIWLLCNDKHTPTHKADTYVHTCLGSTKYGVYIAPPLPPALTHNICTDVVKISCTPTHLGVVRHWS